MNNTFSKSLRSKNMRRRSNAPLAVKRPHDTIPDLGDSIRIIPLGGVEEIGRNMMVVEYGNDIIVLDAGIKFTDHETPGVDYILPNIKYLEDRKDRIRAIVITHGHLDHIGSIPYIIDRLGNPPIYTREFGALLIQKRQVEFPHLAPLDIKIVGADDKSIPLTPNLKVRFFGVTHSIPDSTGVMIETPFGDIVNTGDVRIENENGVPDQKELDHYKMFKDRNILLFCVDSTNIQQPGFSLSEAYILKNIDAYVSSASGRIILATFATQVERVIEFIKMAQHYSRKVIIEGRSMKTNVEIIKHLNLVDTSHIIPIEDMTKYPPNKIMIITTGAQGEEFAALMRMSNKTHKYIRLERSDTIVLSSSTIPGNEKAIEKLKDNLYRQDSKIITHIDSDVHTSGHGKRGELEWLHQQMPYKFFMPIHANHFRLKMHAELAERLGCPRENIIVPDNGSIIEIQEKGTKFVKLPVEAPSEDMVVEGLSIGDISDVVIRDRKMLAEDGIFVVIALIDIRSGRLKKSPDIIARGFVYLRESQELLSEARHIIRRAVEGTTQGTNPINFDYAKNAVTEDVSRFLFQKTAKAPLVIPVLLGV